MTLVSTVYSLFFFVQSIDPTGVKSHENHMKLREHPLFGDL